MKPNFEELKYKYKNEVYRNLLLKKNEFDVQKTWTQNKNKEWVLSDNSYSFLFENIPNNEITDDNLHVIINGFKEIFSISNPAFEEKLEEVCSGSGDEKTKITTLHSSSLCALLFFYGVSSENKLILNLNDKEIAFDEVHFEYQNHVISSKYPSNIDVVLISHSSNIVLFLESKFSEYLYRNKKSNSIGASYKTKFFSKDMYINEALSKESPVISVLLNDKNELFLEAEEPLYLDGFKQMISHYIGLKTLLGEERKSFVKDKCESKKAVTRMVINGANIYLGEILFDNFDFDDGKTSLTSYKQLYLKFISMARKSDSNTKINLVNNVLTYSEIKKSGYKLDEKVIDFYFPN